MPVPKPLPYSDNQKYLQTLSNDPCVGETKLRTIVLSGFYVNKYKDKQKGMSAPHKK